MITGKCKGARDLLPGEMSKLRHIESQFRKACAARCFEEIRTPVIEYYHLFTSAGTLTPRMLGRVYSFLDWDGWSGERVVLRPEGTIPAARLYLENYPKGSAARFFYMENMFSFEENASEPREKLQGGVEIIGSSGTSADVELITLALEVLETLQIGPVELKLSHAGYLRAMLATFGLNPENEEKLYEAIVDGRDMDQAIKSVFEEIEEKKGLKGLILLKEKTLKSLQNLTSVTKLQTKMRQKIENFMEICSLIEALGYKFKMDFAGGRGLEYYTGIYYRIYSNKIEVGGGGRYDSLVNNGNGISIPASGFALYLDKIASLLPEAHPDSQTNSILISTELQDKSALIEVMKAAKALREKGLKTKVALSPDQAGTKRWVLRYLNTPGAIYLLEDRSAPSGEKEWKLNTIPEVLAKMEKLCR